MSIRESRLYDEAFGPRSPHSVKRRLIGNLPRQWDDPTWLQVTIDDGYMVDEDVKAHNLKKKPRTSSRDF